MGKIVSGVVHANTFNDGAGVHISFLITVGGLPVVHTTIAYLSCNQ